VLALAPEELRGLARVVSQGEQHWPRGREETILASSGGELTEAGTEDETSLDVPRHQSVELESDREAMGGRPGEVRGGDELGKCGRP
jgi:hypothetical protein